MDISEVFENRRRNLAALIQRPPFRGVQASFARHIQRSAPQVGQWLSGHRSISDESRDHIETACQLLSGWLDQPQHTGIALDYAPRVESPTIPAPPDIATALPVVVRALAALPSVQLGRALHALEQLDQHPEMVDDAITRINDLLSSGARRKRHGP